MIDTNPRRDKTLAEELRTEARRRKNLGFQLAEQVQRRAPFQEPIEQLKQYLPLAALAAGLTHVERRAGREADEVQLAVGKA